MNKCQLCNLNYDNLTFHHLTPKKINKRKKFENIDPDKGIFICQLCHQKIHSLFSQKQLGERLNSLDKLLQQKQIQQFIYWRQKHPKIIFSPSKKKKITF